MYKASFKFLDVCGARLDRIACSAPPTAQRSSPAPQFSHLDRQKDRWIGRQIACSSLLTEQRSSPTPQSSHLDKQIDRNSVSDPLHFNAEPDPDPRIRFRDNGSESGYSSGSGSDPEQIQIFFFLIFFCKTYKTPRPKHWIERYRQIEIYIQIDRYIQQIDRQIDRQNTSYLVCYCTVF